MIELYAQILNFILDPDRLKLENLARALVKITKFCQLLFSQSSLRDSSMEYLVYAFSKSDAELSFLEKTKKKINQFGKWCFVSFLYVCPDYFSNLRLLVSRQLIKLSQRLTEGSGRLPDVTSVFLCRFPLECSECSNRQSFSPYTPVFS